jgi:hypothetical protein
VLSITLSCEASAAFLFQAAPLFNTGTRWNWLSSRTAAHGWLGARLVCPAVPVPSPSPYGGASNPTSSPASNGYVASVAQGASCGQGYNRPVGGVVLLQCSTAPEGGRHVTADHGVNIFEEVSGLMVPAKA